MPEHQQIQQSTESKTTFQKQATPIIQTPISNPMAIIQRARINPKSLTHADVMQLQRTIGNRAVGRLFSEVGLIHSNAKPVQRQEIPEEEEPLQGKFKNKPEIACPSCFAAPIVQRQEIPEEEEPLQGKFESIQRQEIPEEEEEPLQTKRENNTGMPDNLKAGVESLSSIDMNDVRVHYNSSKPAEVGALAYTQGTNIHVAQGQERHLPHEAWHVVQQKQGRVQATTQMKGIAVNDDVGLESEADEMGARASNLRKAFYMSYPKIQRSYYSSEEVVQRTIEDAILLANKFKGSHQFNSWKGIKASQRKGEFTLEQWMNLKDAKRAKAVHNASGAHVPFQPLSKHERDSLKFIRQELETKHQKHFDFLLALETETFRVFGITGLYEFYRGAHIVFNGPQVYRMLWNLSRSLAVLSQTPAVGAQATPFQVMDKTTAIGSSTPTGLFARLFSRVDENPIDSSDIQGEELSSDDCSKGNLYMRRPQASETSHYNTIPSFVANPQIGPTYPQLGLDLPSPIQGHILFGVVPGTNNTFVQTEGAGFQNTYEEIIRHGLGALWNVSMRLQTGLIGYSTASEKTTSHLQQ